MCLECLTVLLNPDVALDASLPLERRCGEGGRFTGVELCGLEFLAVLLNPDAALDASLGRGDVSVDIGVGRWRCEMVCE